MIYKADELVGERRLEVFREHLGAHSFICLEDEVVIDIQSIHLFIWAYDAMKSERNKHTMLNGPLGKVLYTLWRM